LNRRLSSGQILVVVVRRENSEERRRERRRRRRRRRKTKKDKEETRGQGVKKGGEAFWNRVDDLEEIGSGVPSFFKQKAHVDYKRKNCRNGMGGREKRELGKKKVVAAFEARQTKGRCKRCMRCMRCIRCRRCRLAVSLQGNVIPTYMACRNEATKVAACFLASLPLAICELDSITECC